MDAFMERMRKQVEERPRVYFVCERDWIAGPNVLAIGALWWRNFEAEPGQSVYHKCFILRMTIPRFSLEWR